MARIMPCICGARVTHVRPSIKGEWHAATVTTALAHEAHGERDKPDGNERTFHSDPFKSLIGKRLYSMYRQDLPSDLLRHFAPLTRSYRAAGIPWYLGGYSMKSALTFVLALSVLVSSAQAEDSPAASSFALGSRTQIGDLSSARRDKMNVTASFVFPAGETNFVYHDGEYLYESPTGSPLPAMPDTCLITRPFVQRDGERVVASELSVGASIAVGDTRVWIDDESQLIGAYIRFYNDGFQITCYGTRGHAPTIGDLNRHFGRVFQFIRN